MRFPTRTHLIFQSQRENDNYYVLDDLQNEEATLPFQTNYSLMTSPTMRLRSVVIESNLHCMLSLKVKNIKKTEDNSDDPALQAHQSLEMWQNVGEKRATMTLLDGTIKLPGLDKIIDE